MSTLRKAHRKAAAGLTITRGQIADHPSRLRITPISGDIDVSDKGPAGAKRKPDFLFSTEAGGKRMT